MHGSCAEAHRRHDCSLPIGPHRPRYRGGVQGLAGASRRPLCGRSGSPRARLHRHRVHQQRGPARPDARRQAGEGAGRRARGGGAAADRAGDLRDQPVHTGHEGVHDARRGSGRVMVVRFWGTRGSIPVAMTAAQVQRKLVAALTRAAGRPLDTPQKIREFVERERDYEINGARVRAKLQRHGGDSYGYRIEQHGKVVVYSTDSEHKQDDPAEVLGFVEFFKTADLVIFDSQYSLADAISIKEDWGHSSNVVGVELCQLARAKRLCLYHHEPIFDDERIAALLDETRRLEEITRADHRVEVTAAWDGLEIAL